MDGNHPGSLIWNNAWQNKELVQKDSFWEVHNGRSTLFWDDAWEQLPILVNQEGMEQARNSLLEKGWTLVHHYWKNWNPRIRL
jgi:hypothetical protein